ncbi:MAG: ABC transporter substrate-binding protein [Patescibacteria group bacterium]
MNKKIIWGVVVIVILVGIVWIATNKTSGDKQIVKIGIVAPLTGGASIYGVNLAKGAELALADLKDTKNTYRLVIEDDGTNPANAASAAQKLINIDKVQAIISVTSGTGNAVKPLAASASIPHICICNDTHVADSKFNFTNVVLPPDEAALWLDEAAKQGIKKVAFIGQNQPGINILLENIKKLAPEKGIELVYEDTIEPTVKDFSTNIAKARATKPDQILVVFFPPQIDIIGQQLKNLKVTNFSGMATFALSATPELFNDKWYTDAKEADPAFSARFAQTFPGVRFNGRVAPYAYDSFNMLVNGLEKGNAPQYLIDLTTYNGKVGMITKEKGAGVFKSALSIWTIKDGKPVQQTVK